MIRIAGLKKVNKGRMEELSEEVGVKESLRRKLVRSRLTLGVTNDKCPRCTQIRVSHKGALKKS